MKFLLDESVDFRLATFLLSSGFDTTTIARDYESGLPDTMVLAIALDEERVLITNDSDFGELIFSQRREHVGIILMRLGPYASLETKVQRLGVAIQRHQLAELSFTVVTLHRVKTRVFYAKE